MLAIISMEDLAIALMVSLVEVPLTHQIYQLLVLKLKATRNVNLSATNLMTALRSVYLLVRRVTCGFRQKTPC